MTFCVTTLGVTAGLTPVCWLMLFHYLELVPIDYLKILSSVLMISTIY